MQRFGTASVPTHIIGLAILKSDWDLAVSLLLRPRPGEHPEVEAGRRAWLEENNLKKALDLIPRRCVAERCILEYYSKSKNKNAKEALSTVGDLFPSSLNETLKVSWSPSDSKELATDVCPCVPIVRVERRGVGTYPTARLRETGRRGPCFR